MLISYKPSYALFVKPHSDEALFSPNVPPLGFNIEPYCFNVPVVGNNKKVPPPKAALEAVAHVSTL